MLDTGALIAFERGDRRVLAALARIRERSGTAWVPAGALAQAWRDGARQVRLARLVAYDETEIVPLDAQGARRAARLCGASGTDDVVDASIVVESWERDALVVTSDPDDLRNLDPRLRLLAI